MKKLLLILSIILASFSLKAIHITGGEIEWSCVGQDSFLITTTLYRECATLFPSNLTVTIKCETGALLASETITQPAETDITPTCASSCNKCTDPQFCTFPYGISKFEYVKLFVLSNAGSCCNILISASMCCRSDNITTGASSNDILYLNAKLDRCLFPINASMEFDNDPTTLICLNQNSLLNYQISAQSDIVANSTTDSVSYELTDNCTYSGSYSYDKPISFWGFPQKNNYLPKGIHMDNRNGFLLFNPQKVEQTVVAVKVKRFKKVNNTWIKIAETIRDHQLIVMSCTGNNLPIITGDYYEEICVGDTIQLSYMVYDKDINDSLTLMLDSFASGVQWSITKYSQDSLLAVLNWVPSEQQVSSIPYTFVVNAHDQHCPINGHDYKKVQIRVRSSNLKPGFTILDQNCGKYILEYNYKKVPAAIVNWLINGDTISQNFKCSLDFNQSGLYPLDIIVEDQFGCVQKSVDTFNVQNVLKVELPIDTIICMGDSIQIQSKVIGTSSPLSYLWIGGDTNSYLNTIPLFKDTYFHLSTSNTDGCSDEDSILIKVDDFGISLSQDTITCPGNPVELRATSQFDEGQIVSSFSWLDLSCTCPQGHTDSIIVYMQGTFSCEAINENGCMDKDTIVVIYDKEPELSFLPIPDICLNDENLALDSFVSPKGGIWYGQDTIIVKNNMLQVNKAQAKHYLLFYSYTDTTTQCFTFDKTTVEIKDYPNINMIQAFSFCNVDKYYDLEPYISPVGGIWSGSTAIGFDHFFNPSKANSTKPLVYKVTDSNGCVNSKEIYFNLNPLPIVDFVADKDTGTLPLQVQFSNQSSISSGIITDYLWYFGDGDSSFFEHPTHTYLNQGLLDVKLIAISDSSCIGELTKEQLIEVFSSLGKHPDQIVQIYPNPVSQSLFIDLGKTTISQSISLFNTLGEKVFSQNEKTLPCTINVSTFKPGVYLLQIELNENQFQKRILIE
ncbi:MAG: T9SS type A sorting domain-containing protein [Bacteroidetes bacterium]|nr:T9SS type A sorting domain-containing protein [Bacteroidota bacterium]